MTDLETTTNTPVMPATAVLDTEGCFVQADQAFVELIGASPEGLIGIPLEDALQVVRVGQGTPPLETPWAAEVRPFNKRHRWLELSAERNKATCPIVLTATDITQTRSDEIFRSASVKLSRLIADGFRADTEHRWPEALRGVLPFDRIRLMRFDVTTDRADCLLSSRGDQRRRDRTHRPKSQTELDAGLEWRRTIIGVLGSGARMVVHDDLRRLESPPDEVQTLIAEGFCSVVGVPLRIAHRVVGALMLDRVASGAPTPSQLVMLGDLAPLFSAALDRMRLERAAVDSASVYATVFETAGEGIILSDIETGRIEAVNTRYLELSGYRRRRLLNNMRIQDVDLLTTADGAERARMIREQLGPELTYHRKRNGRRLPVEVTRRIFTWRGRATELTVVRDVRERMKAERQIRQLAQAVEAVSLGVLLTDPDGIVVFANPSLHRMLGENTVGRSVHELRSLHTEDNYEGEVAIDLDNGVAFPAYISRASFETQDGERAGAVEIWTDLTEQKERDQLLMQADKLASLGQTAAGVAHEINNPLAFIIANLRTLFDYVDDIRASYDELSSVLDDSKDFDSMKSGLQKVVLDEELKETMGDIKELTDESLHGAERVRAIVADLRAYARRRDIMQPCDMAEVVRNALTLAKNEVRHRAEVITEVPNDLPRVIGSPGRLEQVVLNLLLNAAHALPTEPRPGGNKIIVRLLAQRGFVICEVEDTGSGIPDAVIEKIFNQFFTTKDKKRGTGLGLFISKKIVENHGGSISVRSVPGVGSTFVLRIPAEADDSIEDMPTEPGVKRCRILLIDDEELVLESLRRVLVPHHEVDTADSGREGLKAALDNDYDVILCDLAMDDLRGDELYAELKQVRPHVGRRFVIISGGALSPKAASVTEGDGVHQMVKPIQPERLLGLIQKISKQNPAGVALSHPAKS